MSAQLVQHLKNVCNQDESVKILLSQWEFDRLLVGKALENVGSYYPHFSNHNASHSNQILINIERILGEDIKRLSATDTWLLLEAAYWHDIGMLVDAKSAKSLHTNPDFQFMVKRIATDNSHDLHAFAKEYIDKGWSAAIGSQGHPFDGVEKYRQLIAEWFRSKHAQRAGEITQDPFTSLEINSPRTELLPKRLYRYLGNICMAHGTSFEKMMTDLPYKQTGLGLENCHPRFVACMLRLGDLFDLDDNRFCPVMQKHVHNMPELSQRHHDKHLSIREFQLDRTTVRVVAECEDEMVFVETQTWFDWIREEFQHQMSHWKFIAPEREFGLLPTLEQLDVKIIGKRILIDHKPMRFSLNERQVLEILEGSGLYEKNIHSLREAIQNSIDATLKRIWVQYSGRKDFFKYMHPYDEEFQKITKNFQIDINIEEIKEEGADTEYLCFVIKDHGVGFSLGDLKRLSQVGGSLTDKGAFKVDQMPEWMKPSGEFGIGIQSYFLLSKKLDQKNRAIEIKTRSVVDMQEYKVELNSPLSSKKGYCFIEKGDGSNCGVLDFGSEIKIYASLSEKMDGIFAEIKDVFRYSPIPIFLNEKKISNDDGFSGFFWLKSFGCYIFLCKVTKPKKKSENSFFDGRTTDGIGFFRGAKVKRNSIGFGDFFTEKGVVLYNGSAKDTLMYNRSSWRDGFFSDLLLRKKDIFEEFLSGLNPRDYESSSDFVFGLKDFIFKIKSCYPDLVSTSFEDFLNKEPDWFGSFIFEKDGEVNIDFNEDANFFIFSYDKKPLFFLKNYYRYAEECVWDNKNNWLGLDGNVSRYFDLILTENDYLKKSVVDFLRENGFLMLKIKNGVIYVKPKNKSKIFEKHFVAVIESRFSNQYSRSIYGFFEEHGGFYTIDKDVVADLFEGLTYKNDKDYYVLPFLFDLSKEGDGSLVLSDGNLEEIKKVVDYQGDDLEGFIGKMRIKIEGIIRDVAASRQNMHPKQ